MLEDKIQPAQRSTLSHTETNPDDTIQKTQKLERNFGDLYVIGKLWIDILQTGLLGTRRLIPSIIPVVEAAPPPAVPQKPPKMKYKDLPLYTSPHFEYKTYVDDKLKCPEAQKKLMQQYLLPTVTSYRKYYQQNYCDFVTEFRIVKKQAMGAINEKKNKFKKYMRDPDNLVMRQGVLAVGGLTGFCIGRGGGIPRRLFFTGAGLLAAGALCFPKETDETFRNLTFTTAKMFIAMYNKYCKKHFVIRERLACETELPPPPGPRKDNVCLDKSKK